MFSVKSASHYFGITLLLGLCCIRASSGLSLTSTVHIEEEKPKGSFVVNVAELFKADKLKLSRRKFKFKMLSQELKSSESDPQSASSTWVKLDPQTGVMTTSRKIDRDTECIGIQQCVVHIQAIMLPQTSFTLVDLNLVIDDVNDHAPSFPLDKVEIRINEAWQIGEVYNLDSVQAVDRDAGSNAEIQYELSTNSYFTLQQSSEKEGLRSLQLVLKERLDHEREQSVRMILSAKDGGNPPMQNQIDLKVTVVDANDNSPVFDRAKHSVTLVENSAPGLVVETLTARDVDSGELGRVRYSISARNGKLARGLFAIDSVTGELRLKEKVNRKRHDGIRVLVEARDSDLISPKMGEAWIMVSVEDLNDNAPQINAVFILHEVENTVYISETEPEGTFMLRISVTDNDFGDNGKVQLEMKITTNCAENFDGESNGQEAFVLHPDGLVATQRPLDRESCDNYVIALSACDRGNPSKCSSESIKVAVIDENEFAPRFKASTQRVMVLENAPTDTVVTQIQAHDGDAKGENALVINTDSKIVKSKNGAIGYIISSGGSGPFSINRETGVIRLLGQLDREKKAEWKITVIARDGGIPIALESHCTVIIEVGDVNDNEPRFQNPSENNSVIYASTVSDGPIIKLKADDCDAGRNAAVRFKLLSEEPQWKNASLKTSQYKKIHNSSGNFVLNPTTGELKLNFSRRNFSNVLGAHTVKVQAYDMGSPVKSSNLTMNIRIIDYPVPLLSPGDMSVAGQDPFLFAVYVGSGFLLIAIIITVVVVLRCHKAKKESKSYSLPKDDADNGIVENDDYVIEVMSVDTRALEPTDAPVETNYGGMSKVSAASQLIEPTVPGTSRSDLVQKLAGDEMGYLTVSRNNNTISPAHSDGDSGKGDSEADGSSYKTQKKDFTRPNCASTMGANCTEQCVQFGHSDSCWMPLIHNLPTTHGVRRPGVPQHMIPVQRTRQPLGVFGDNSRVHRSSSRASNLDEVAFDGRTRYPDNYKAHIEARSMSPHQGVYHSTSFAHHSQKLSGSCMVLPRASVASASNLMVVNEKQSASSSANNFVTNCYAGKRKFDAENAQNLLNPSCFRPAKSAAFMSVATNSALAASPNHHCASDEVSRADFVKSPVQVLAKSNSGTSSEAFVHITESMIV